MIKVGISGLNINISGNFKNNIQKSLRESAEAVKDSIKQEMNGAKSGKLNRKTGRRRSAAGESLAKDTGDALTRLTSISSGFNSIDVGFERGDNEYMKEWENSNRPTLKKAAEASISKIEAIFRKNLR